VWNPKRVDACALVVDLRDVAAFSQHGKAQRIVLDAYRLPAMENGLAQIFD
jgi:hypothetical protein